MALTILAIPLIFLGGFLKVLALEGARCLTIGFIKEPLCFAAGSDMPEIIKYGCVLAGFALIYAGRRQIKRAREGR
ncbi:MAG: hypothetical protein ABI830_14440 [Pseudolabrys sp.]